MACSAQAPEREAKSAAVAPARHAVSAVNGTLATEPTTRRAWATSPRGARVIRAVTVTTGRSVSFIRRWERPARSGRGGSLGSNSKQFMAAQRRQAVRLTGILLIFVIGTVLACLNSKHFFSSFENFIGVLLFFFVPWSAINLVDYYLVKRGRYDVPSFFTPNGIYGKFQWWACLCYVITLAVQVPFLDQTFYQGVLVPKMGGADISWIVGFGVASLLYLAGAKRFAGGQQAVPAAADPVGSAS